MVVTEAIVQLSIEVFIMQRRNYITHALSIIVLSTLPFISMAQPAGCTLLELLTGECPVGGGMGGDDEQFRNSSDTGKVSMQTVNDITQESGGVFIPIPQSTSTLTRTMNGVVATLSTSGLEPDEVHTMWWVVFNNPEACTGGTPDSELECLPPGDVGNADVNASVFGGSGQVSDLYGRVTFNAHAFVGEDNGLTLNTGPGIVDPMNAEIHLIVENHGPAESLQNAGLLEEAMQYQFVGCREGEPNEGLCGGNIQGTVHVR